jgi:hypothetical protein
MIEKLSDPDFQLALFIAVGSLLLFAYWLRTGGRRSR